MSESSSSSSDEGNTKMLASIANSVQQFVTEKQEKSQKTSLRNRKADSTKDDDFSFPELMRNIMVKDLTLALDNTIVYKGTKVEDMHMYPTPIDEKVCESNFFFIYWIYVIG